MSPRQERPRPFQLNLNKILTAAMKKGTPICDLSNDLEQNFGLDPSIMPTRPEGVHLTPISPLDQVPVWGQQQAEETERRLQQLREADVPTATHAEPDSTHNEEAFETKKQAKERIQWWIKHAPNQKPKLSPIQSPTGQEHANKDPQADAPKPETRQEKRKNIKRITFDLNQTKSPSNIRDRLGPRLNPSTPRAGTHGLNPWNVWKEGQDPANHENWSRQELIDELRQIKAHQEEKDPHTDELGSTDGSEDQQ
jgi:hypothetical protein